MAGQSNNDDLKTLAIVGVVGFGIYKIAKIFEDPNAHHQEQTQHTIDDDITKLINAGKVPSYPDSQYYTFADLLQAAMEGMGTDEDAILAVFEKINSDLDVLLLVKAFGIRSYHEFAWIDEDYTLTQWFQNELSDGMFEDINDILKDKGINFYF